MRSSIVSLPAGLQPDRTPIRALPIPPGSELPGMHCPCPVPPLRGDHVQFGVLADGDIVDERLIATIRPDQLEHRILFRLRPCTCGGRAVPWLPAAPCSLPSSMATTGTTTATKGATIPTRANYPVRLSPCCNASAPPSYPAGVATRYHQRAANSYGLTSLPSYACLLIGGH